MEIRGKMFRENTRLIRIFTDMNTKMFYGELSAVRIPDGVASEDWIEIENFSFISGVNSFVFDITERTNSKQGE